MAEVEGDGVVPGGVVGALESLVVKSKPMGNSGRRILTEPREEGVEFLHLDVIELMIFIAKRV
jgi:hypothetical protein